MQTDPLNFENYSLKQISFELAERTLATYKMQFQPRGRKRKDGTYDYSVDEDYIEPFVALRESFNDVVERYNSDGLNKQTMMRYQRLLLPEFICDSSTFKSMMFLVRLDLRALASSLLEYRNVPLTVRMEFSETVPAGGLACLILAEHNATVAIEPDGTTSTFLVTK